MLESLKLYVEECRWLARNGLLNGNGLYFGPGADSVPLIATSEVGGHLTGFSRTLEDTLTMAKTLQLLQIPPIEIFGQPLSYNGHDYSRLSWTNYTHTTGNMTDFESVEKVLGNERFDYIILKGNEFAFPMTPYDYNLRLGVEGGTDKLRDYYSFLEFVHKNYTKKGTFLIVSFDDSASYFSDGAKTSRFLVEKLGYADVTDSRYYTSISIIELVLKIRKIKDRTLNIVYDPEYDMDENVLNDPQLRSKFMMNTLLAAGDFGIFKRIN